MTDRYFRENSPILLENAYRNEFYQEQITSLIAGCVKTPVTHQNLRNTYFIGTGGAVKGT